MTRRRGRRRKKLLDDLKDRRGYCQLKEEALDRTMWGIVLEEALDLSFDRLLMMMVMTVNCFRSDIHGYVANCDVMYGVFLVCTNNTSVINTSH